VCLRRLYLPVTEDGIISCIVDDVEYKWRYRRDESSQVGELVSDDGTRAYTWYDVVLPPPEITAHGRFFSPRARGWVPRDAEYLRPKSDSALDCGYGVWDGIWLTWFVLRLGPRSPLTPFSFCACSSHWLHCICVLLEWPGIRRTSGS
jgi:hypothetical protein